MVEENDIHHDDYHFKSTLHISSHQVLLDPFNATTTTATQSPASSMLPPDLQTLLLQQHATNSIALQVSLLDTLSPLFIQ
jgi:hypothetical protein